MDSDYVVYFDIPSCVREEGGGGGGGGGGDGSRLFDLKLMCLFLHR